MSDKTSWMINSLQNTRFPKLEKDLEVDVVVIGGGLAGVLTAYLLSKSDCKVALVEKAVIGSGVSSQTTAFLTQDIDTDLQDLVSMYGKKSAKLIWQSHQKSIDLIEKIIQKEKISCDFKRVPGYVYAMNGSDFSSLEEENKIAKQLGFAVDIRQDNKLQINNSGYLVLKNQAKFHPLRFLDSLTNKLHQRGIRIYENTEVIDLAGEKNITVNVKGGVTIRSKKVVIATYDPAYADESWKFPPRNSYYLSYVIEAEIDRQLTEGIYWDLNNPYNYFRVDGKTIILGGEDIKSFIPKSANKKYKLLEKYLKSLLPDTKVKVTKKWNSTILETMDGLAYIGQFSQNRYVATGFSGNGITYSGIAAMIISGLILNHKNEYREIYDPNRVPTTKQILKKGFDYTKEFINGVFLK